MMSIQGVLGFLQSEYERDPKAKVAVSVLIEAINYDEEIK